MRLDLQIDPADCIPFYVLPRGHLKNPLPSGSVGVSKRPGPTNTLIGWSSDTKAARQPEICPSSIDLRSSNSSAPQGLLHKNTRKIDMVQRRPDPAAAGGKVKKNGGILQGLGTEQFPTLSSSRIIYEQGTTTASMSPSTVRPARSRTTLTRSLHLDDSATVLSRGPWERILLPRHSSGLAALETRVRRR